MAIDGDMSNYPLNFIIYFLAFIAGIVGIIVAELESRMSRFLFFRTFF